MGSFFKYFMVFVFWAITSFIFEAILRLPFIITLSEIDIWKTSKTFLILIDLVQVTILWIFFYGYFRFFFNKFRSINIRLIMPWVWLLVLFKTGIGLLMTMGWIAESFETVNLDPSFWQGLGIPFIFAFLPAIAALVWVESYFQKNPKRWYKKTKS